MRSALLAICLLILPQVGAAQRDSWIATWTAAPEPSAPSDPGAKDPVLHLEDQTVRERVRVSIGGTQIRIRLSNECGTSPLVVGSITVGVPSDAASVAAASIRRVTFSGEKSVTIPAGAPVLSDPVAFPVAYGSEISISLYFPNRVATPTVHQLALKRAVVSLRGDHTQEEKIQGGAEIGRWLSISAVLVPSQLNQRVVVAFGDSIVDGDGSTPDADANWPNDLIRRLGKSPDGSKMAVVNAGIAGNRLLGDGPIASLGASALARFDRDALAVAGVTHIILLQGVNDIGFPGAKLDDLILADPADTRTSEDLIGAYRQLIARAHVRGIKVIGATLTPFEGVDIPGYYSESKEATRQAVNKWIRTSGEFDGVIDFDGVLRDPEHPSRLLPRLASEDRLHPNDAGYQAMADAIDLNLLR
jgi:lysophospholipase L1-like esterase